MLSLIHAIYRIIIPPAFTIRIKNGTFKCTQGKISPKILSALNNVSKKENIRAGSIYGIHKSGRIRFEFSANISKKYHQQFRNIIVNIK